MASDSDPREIYDPRTRKVTRVVPVFTAAPQYLPTHSREPGAYEKRVDSDGHEHVTGVCAGCGGDVSEADAFVIRYHPTLPGGLFHRSCDPTPADPRWYSVEEGE